QPPLDHPGVPSGLPLLLSASLAAGKGANVGMRISRASGTTQTYECASPKHRERRKCTNADLIGPSRPAGEHDDLDGSLCGVQLQSRADLHSSPGPAP